MFLDRVTVTGADDSTDIGFMHLTAQRYPWVEWGILLSSAQIGGYRFPSRKWMDRLAEIQGREVGKLHFSGHLCGRWVRRAIRGDWGFIADVGPLWNLLERVQLNFHALPHDVDEAEFHDSISRGAGVDDKQIIFQIDGRNDEIAARAAGAGLNVAALFDKSGGAGVVPNVWPSPMTGVPVGYAGGLSPMNTTRELGLIAKVAGDDGPFWIDAETRLRSPDNSRLDERAVLGFLDAAAPWVDV